ncbi:MAG: hypothetical protein IH955_10115 [Chloroflexi bacterium]|nr:hypothetical protein [Chloroflexota bacterium]
MAAVGGFFIVGTAGGGVDGPEAAALGGVSAAGGLLLAFARGLESAFKFQERADFYRVLRSEAANLIAATRYVVKTDNEFRSMVRKYQSLNFRTATAVPKGQGMQAIKLFYEDLDNQGIIEVPRELLSTE